MSLLTTKQTFDAKFFLGDEQLLLRICNKWHFTFVICSQHNLTITNTIFQQATRHKTTWMHPGTKEWHMIDYVITRQRDVKDVHHTRAMCGSCTWSDHRLVKCKLAIRAKAPRHLRRQKSAKKLNIARLTSTETRAMLSSKLQEAYAAAESTGTNATALWNSFKSVHLKLRRMY